MPAALFVKISHGGHRLKADRARVVLVVGGAGVAGAHDASRAGKEVHMSSQVRQIISAAGTAADAGVGLQAGVNGICAAMGFAWAGSGGGQRKDLRSVARSALGLALS